MRPWSRVPACLPADARGRSAPGRLSVRVSATILAWSLAVSAASPVRLVAQSRVRTEVDTARATVGDRITMRVTVQRPAGARVQWPDSLDLAPFEILAMETNDSAAVLTLTAFELGELEIPSFQVDVVDADGQREVLSTEAWGVDVASVGVDESGDIRDIRGPLSIPMSVLRVLLMALTPLLVIALLYTLARRLRSRERASPTSAPPPLERPAHEVALEALAALEASDLLERGRVKEYHIAVSDVLRTYVERRFRVDALEMTSREVLQGLERASIDASFREGLGAFLDQCDLVKFAKVRPSADVSRQVLELGRRLVTGSAPRHEVDAGDEAHAGSVSRVPTVSATAGGGA